MNYVASKGKRSYSVSDNIKLNGINVLFYNSTIKNNSVDVDRITETAKVSDVNVSKNTKLMELGKFLWISFNGISVMPIGDK